MAEYRTLLDTMPFDKAFIVEGGNEELCHATGFAVAFDNEPDCWWNEHEDSNGNLYYGR